MAWLRRHRALAAGLALVLFSGLAVGETSTRASRRTPVVIAVEKAAPTVVSINTESLVATRNPLNDLFSMDPFWGSMFPNQVQRVQSLGSGVIVHPDGYVITNMHVVGNAQSIKVSLLDGRVFDVEKVVPNPTDDLALLKLKATEKFPAITIADSHDLMIGETLVAVGNPFGWQNTVTTGVVSAINRSVITGDNVEMSGVIQTDAAINQGNSGGPLLNINGELIGINSMIDTPSGGSAGVGFAIPSARITKMINRVLYNIVALEDLMGISGITNMSGLSQHYVDVPDTGGKGVVIREMDPKGYAAQAGLRPADVLVRINDRPVVDLEAYRNVIASVTGTRLHLVYFRRDRAGSKEYDVEFTFPKDAAGGGRVETKTPPPVRLEWMGLSVGAMGEQDARALGVAPNQGVVVFSVADGSAAFGLVRPGDVVTTVEGDAIVALADFRAAMGRFKDYARVRLGLLRDGQKRTVELKRG